MTMHRAGVARTRRHFLTVMGGSLVATLPGCQQESGSGPQSPSSGGGTASGGALGQQKTKLGVALLGLGSYAGGQLAPALQLTQHCHLAGIVTGTPSKIPTWQADYDIPEANVYSYETLSTIAENDSIDVVYVVTPTSLHMKYAVAAANAGKHVWCEKPMAMNEQECAQIIEACQKNGVKLSIGYRMQHEPNTQQVIEFAQEKPFGAIERAEALAGYSGYHGGETDVWRLKASMGGGALYDMGVYTINAARYATGEEPLRVKSARQWTERPQLFDEVDEWTEFELEFPSGAVAYGRTSFGENINRLEVTCAKGSYYLDPMQSYTGVTGATSEGTSFAPPIENQQAVQMDDDALAILEDRQVLVPGEEGMRDIRLVQAIMESAQSGMPVELT